MSGVDTQDWVKWLPEDTIFATVHGSHLYGTQHNESDKDLYVVVLDTGKNHALHQVWNGYDTVFIGLGTFLVQAMSGTHQAVEALFSQRKVWVNQDYAEMLERIQVFGPEVTKKYVRTIRKFCFGDFKRRRHAVRLAENLRDLSMKGRMNPTHSETAIYHMTGMATELEGEALWARLGERYDLPDLGHPAYGGVSA